jgi:hypothetical protein
MFQYFVLNCYAWLNLSNGFRYICTEHGTAFDPSNYDPGVHQPLRQCRGSALKHATTTSFLISNIVYTALLANEPKNEIYLV